MRINTNELKTCLLYAFKPYFKEYNIRVKDVKLKIDEWIYIKAVVHYENYILDLQGKFQIDYTNGSFIFKNIEGKASYLFLQLDLLQLIKQLVNDDRVIIRDQSCYINIDIPIERIDILDDEIELTLQ